MTTKDHHPQVKSTILNSKMNLQNCEWEITSQRENFWDIPFFNFCSKNISRDNVIQKAINCQFCFIFFFSPTRRDPHCKRLQTNKKATQHEVISQQWQPRIIIRRKYPPSWTPKWTYKIANEKLHASAITSELFHFSNFWVKKISRDNAIQKAKHCQFWPIFFFSSRSNIHHLELQKQHEKLRMRNYKQARELLRYSIFKTFVWKILIEITQFKDNNLPLLTYFVFQSHEKRSAL